MIPLSAWPALALGVLQAPAGWASTPLESARPLEPAPLVWDDFDGDGFLDALAVTPAGSLQLVRNAQDGSFVDETARAGLGGVAGARFVLARDVNGDGRTDLFVGTEAGPGRLFANEGGFFTDVTEANGLTLAGRDLEASFLDYDADGRLDLHVVQTNGHAFFHGLRGGGFELVRLPGEPAGGFAIAASGVGGAGDESLPSSVSETDPSRTGTGDDSTGGSTNGYAGAGRRTQPVPSSNIESPAGGSLAASSLPGTGDLSDCVVSLADASGGSCLPASSIPLVGHLYPISPEFYIDPVTGFVGIGTTSPSYPLEVAGQLISGTGNNASGVESAIGGGRTNTATGAQSTIAGGDTNSANGLGAFVGSGAFNAAVSERATIAGGVGNIAAYRSFVGSGDNNRATGNVSTVVGGDENEALQAGAFVGGGQFNIADATHASVGGGRANTANGVGAIVAGGANNMAGGAFAFVGGGGDGADPSLGNQAHGDRSAIVGGAGNSIDAASSGSFVGGGTQNEVAASGDFNVVLGGDDNAITGTAAHAVIAGGASHEMPGDRSVIGGGLNHTVNGTRNVVLGGETNIVTGAYATIPGGQANFAAGAYSFAAGNRARALHDGAMVFADSEDADFASTGADQFLIRAGNGVGIGLVPPTSTLTVNGAIESTTDGLVFPDGSVQTEAKSGTGVPTGAMVMGPSPTPPPGFSLEPRVTVATGVPATLQLVDSVPMMPTTASVAVVDDKIYVMGGFVSSTAVTSVHVYDPDTVTWTTGAPLPVAVVRAAAVESAGRIHVSGGSTTGFTDSTDVHQRYDPGLDSWQTLAPMSIGRADHGMEEVDGKLYVFGGVSGSLFGGLTYESSMEVYDPMTDSWTPRAAMSQPRTLMATGVLDGLIFAVAGVDQYVSPSTLVEVYDPAADTWTLLDPVPLGGGSQGVVFQGHLQTLIGGFPAEYDPLSDQWVGLANVGFAVDPWDSLVVVDGELWKVSSVLERYLAGNSIYHFYRKD